MCYLQINSVISVILYVLGLKNVGQSTCRQQTFSCVTNLDAIIYNKCWCVLSVMWPNNVGNGILRLDLFDAFDGAKLIEINGHFDNISKNMSSMRDNLPKP